MREFQIFYWSMTQFQPAYCFMTHALTCLLVYDPVSKCLFVYDTVQPVYLPKTQVSKSLLVYVTRFKLFIGV